MKTHVAVKCISAAVRVVVAFNRRVVDVVHVLSDGSVLPALEVECRALAAVVHHLLGRGQRACNVAVQELVPGPELHVVAGEPGSLRPAVVKRDDEMRRNGVRVLDAGSSVVSVRVSVLELAFHAGDCADLRVDVVVRRVVPATDVHRVSGFNRPFGIAVVSRLDEEPVQVRQVLDVLRHCAVEAADDPLVVGDDLAVVALVVRHLGGKARAYLHAVAVELDAVQLAVLYVALLEGLRQFSPRSLRELAVPEPVLDVQGGSLRNTSFMLACYPLP